MKTGIEGFGWAMLIGAVTWMLIGGAGRIIASNAEHECRATQSDLVCRVAMNR